MKADIFNQKSDSCLPKLFAFQQGPLYLLMGWYVIAAALSAHILARGMRTTLYEQGCDLITALQMQVEHSVAGSMIK